MIYRHGDVNLIPVKAMPKSGTPVAHKGKYILARGEATGSVHELSVENPEDMILVEKDGTLFLELKSKGTLIHTHDHETITIEPRKYVQVPEREVDHFSNTVRRVVD